MKLILLGCSIECVTWSRDVYGLILIEIWDLLFRPTHTPKIKKLTWFIWWHGPHTICFKVKTNTFPTLLELTRLLFLQFLFYIYINNKKKIKFFVGNRGWYSVVESRDIILSFESTEIWSQTNRERDIVMAINLNLIYRGNNLL